MIGLSAYSDTISSVAARSVIEKAHNIPFFRKELLDQLDKTIPIDYKLRITDFI